MITKYTRKYALKIIKKFKKNGIISNLIGTLPSYHDIDILIKNKDTKALRRKLETILSITSYEKTDWNGMFAKTKYGIIDIFFKNPE